MANLTTILSTVLFATFAPTLVVGADTYFTSYPNPNCTGDDVGTFPSSQTDKRYLEVKFKSTPTDLTACNEADFKVGTSSTKSHWVLAKCPTGSSTQVNISTYKGNTGSCTAEGNQMGYYMIDAAQVANLIAGNCAKATLTVTWGSSNDVRSDHSVKLTGFTATDSVVCSLCGRTCAGAGSSGNTGGNSTNKGNTSGNGTTVTKKATTAAAKMTTSMPQLLMMAVLACILAM